MPRGGARPRPLGMLRDRALRSGVIRAFNDRSGFPEVPLRRFARGETARIMLRNATVRPNGIHLHDRHFHELDAGDGLGRCRDRTLVAADEGRELLCVFDTPANGSCIAMFPDIRRPASRHGWSSRKLGGVQREAPCPDGRRVSVTYTARHVESRR